MSACTQAANQEICHTSGHRQDMPYLLQMLPMYPSLESGGSR